VIAVNDTVIAREAVAAEACRHADAPDPEAAAGRALAIRELLRARARELGLAADDDAALDALIEREVTVPEPTPAECRQYYDANPQKFVDGEIVEASHILFAVMPRAPVEAIRAQAEATLREARAQPERFAALAARLSNCPSAAQGGSLGQLQRGQTVPEFETAVFADTAVGVLPRLVSTRYGFHVVRVARRIEGRRLPFEQVRERIAAFLAGRVRAVALRQYVRILAGRARLSGVDLEAADSPLVR
jgi:peptidyl-prolyl cis-trans isomerase C